MLYAKSWMNSEETLRSIHEVREKLIQHADPVRMANSLRKQFSTEVAAFVQDQAELQIRAKRKFSQANRMLFTRVGLEQATSEAIAQYKYSCILPCERLFDICCGIGGDAIGMVDSDNLTCVDHDSQTAFFAEHNLRVYGATSATVKQESFEETKIPVGAFVHVDPDRRTKGRTTRAEFFSPNLSSVFTKLAKQNTCSIKLASATRFEHSFPVPVRQEWIGHQRECKQLLLSFGEHIHVDARRATVLFGENEHQSFDGPEERSEQVVAPAMEEFLYEPHSALLASELTDHFARQHQLGRLSFGSVYLTGSVKLSSPFVAGFHILETCAMKAKTLKSALASHDFGQIEWKSRGVDAADVKRLSKTRTEGARKGVVVLTRMGSKYVALICQRLDA